MKEQSKNNHLFYTKALSTATETVPINKGEISPEVAMSRAELCHPSSHNITLITIGIREPALQMA